MEDIMRNKAIAEALIKSQKGTQLILEAKEREKVLIIQAKRRKYQERIAKSIRETNARFWDLWVVNGHTDKGDKDFGYRRAVFAELKPKIKKLAVRSVKERSPEIIT